MFILLNAIEQDGKTIPVIIPARLIDFVRSNQAELLDKTLLPCTQVVSGKNNLFVTESTKEIFMMLKGAK